MVTSAPAKALAPRADRVTPAVAGPEQPGDVAEAELADERPQDLDLLPGAAVAQLRHQRQDQLGLAIRERLAQADPNNAEWQHDLSVVYTRVGDVLMAQGNPTEALKSFTDSLAIRERLAQADPSNAEWQRALAFVNERLGGVHIERKETDKAKAAFERALAIYDKLTARFPDDIPALVRSTVPSSLVLGDVAWNDAYAFFVVGCFCVRSSRDKHHEKNQDRAIDGSECPSPFFNCLAVPSREPF
jgi:tetratricopeptide (TPR) repeat protein